MNMNVFNWPHSKSYYLTHPWKWFQELGQNLKAAWMRATKGWCYSDCWNLDEAFLTVMPRILRYLADNGSAYPGTGKWDTPEKWGDWLNSIADLMAAASIDVDESNEFAEDFYKMAEKMRTTRTQNNNVIVTFSDTDEYDEVKELYFERRKELEQQRKKSLRSAMEAFSEGIVEGVLWD